MSGDSLYAVFPPAFRLETRFGHCVGVHLATTSADPTVLLSLLHPAERPLAEGLRGARLVEFVGGRVAARLARRALSAADGPTLRAAGGTPLAEGIAISIAHTRHLAVALAGNDGSRPVGVDVERLAPDPGDHLLTERIVTPEEEAADLASAPLPVVARLALKEAAWKALYPLAGPLALRAIAVIRDRDGVSVTARGSGCKLDAELRFVAGHALAIAAATDDGTAQVAADGAGMSAARRRSSISQPAASPSGTQIVSQTQSAGVTFAS